MSIDADGLIAFTQALVRTPSVFRPDMPGANEAEVVRLVCRQLDSWGWRYEVEEVVPGRENVVVRLPGKRPGPVLLFEGHTDVVTEGDRASWTHDPFGAEIVDGRMYGRGSADMKSGLAAMLFATHALLASGAEYNGEIRLAILCDEEGMMLGAKDFVRRGHADDVAGAICCEPEEREVCLWQKGSMRLRVTLNGRMAHGAMPESGANPNIPLATVIQRLEALQERLQREFPTHQFLGKPYVTPTVLRSGSAAQMNVVPAAADLFLDLRTIPGMQHAALAERVRVAVEDALEDPFTLDLEVIDDRPATETAQNAPVVDAMLRAHRAVYGEDARLGGVPGSTDGTILWRERGIPIVTYGPGDKLIPHQADEFVQVQDIVAAAEVYAAAAKDFLSR